MSDDQKNSDGFGGDGNFEDELYRAAGGIGFDPKSDPARKAANTKEAKRKQKAAKQEGEFVEAGRKKAGQPAQQTSFNLKGTGDHRELEAEKKKPASNNTGKGQYWWPPKKAVEKGNATEDVRVIDQVEFDRMVAQLIRDIDDRLDTFEILKTTDAYWDFKRKLATNLHELIARACNNQGGVLGRLRVTARPYAQGPLPPMTDNINNRSDK